MQFDSESYWAATRMFMGLLALFMFAGAQAKTSGPVLSGVVTRVLDGDTIDVQLESGPIRVRLNGIDTPERGQPWAKEATAALSLLVMGKNVELEPFQQDRYERLIANVFVADVDVGAELVKQGHAWAYRKYLTRENLQLCSLEAVARSAQRGLWSLPPEDRFAPWDWRKKPKRFINYTNESAAQCVAAVGT